MQGQVPDDVIQQILQNLPVKSLLRFLSVCSSWQSLIKSPSFMSNHLTKTNCQEQQLLFVSCWVDNDSWGHSEWQYSLRVNDDDKEFKEYRKLINLPFKTVSRWGFSEIVGCCNGLVCLKKKDKDSYRLWNPTFGKLFTIPESNLVGKFDAIVDATKHGCEYGAYTCTLEGFGFDSSTNDYKLLRIVRVYVKDMFGFDSSSVGGWIDIYSYKAGSWKDITPADDIQLRFHLPCACQRQIPFARGFLYFLEYNTTRKIVWQFDLASEVFRDIILAPEMAAFPRYPLLGPLRSYGDSSIAFFERFGSNDGITGFYIWLMHENCEAESYSWSKVFVPVEEEASRLIRTPLLVSKNGELIMEKYFRGIVSYNPSRKQCHFVSEKGYGAFVNYYVESLAFLDIENEATDAEFESALVNVDCKH